LAYEISKRSIVKQPQGRKAVFKSPDIIVLGVRCLHDSAIDRFNARATYSLEQVMSPEPDDGIDIHTPVTGGFSVASQVVKCPTLYAFIKLTASSAQCRVAFNA